MLPGGAAGLLVRPCQSCLLTEVPDVQAQQLIEEWIEEQVIKIDENKYDLALPLCSQSHCQTRGL